MDEHQRGLALAVHAVLHVDAIGRDRDARRALGLLGRWPATRRVVAVLLLSCRS